MILRRRCRFCGAVQGVGFRPHVSRVAHSLGLTGWVINTPEGATAEVEGPPDAVEAFSDQVSATLPNPGRVDGVASEDLDPLGSRAFEIRTSAEAGSKTALILPDIAPCPLCIAEMRDPANRRHRYPFINCTHCGPRYSIIESIPYDRPNTSMKGFQLCEACRAEYEDPEDRRFHAQPIACPVCGPQLEFQGHNELGLMREEALQAAVRSLRAGRILAVKGVSGFHLMVDARDDSAVRRLRERKRREAKPLAVMVPSLDAARAIVELDAEEEAWLVSASAPIVIARSKGSLADSVAPGNPNLGVMLPSSPLHILLMEEFGVPVVATSGNLSDEPLCTDNEEALDRLRGIADDFLLHDRPIVRPIDDSVVSRLGEGVAVLRRARGLAPIPFPLGAAEPGLVAFGSHLKGSVAVTETGSILFGQHVGDLDNALARRRLEDEAQDLAALHETQITGAIHDLHPDYASTLVAQSLGVPYRSVQHHAAHAAALAVDREIEGDFLAVTWDGVGLGPDDTIWGGEFMAVRGGAVSRVGSLRPFLLPGGDAASREGFRSALAILFEASGEDGFAAWQPADPRADSIRAILRSGRHCPATTSAGRLFDAAAALGAGIERSRFEGEAAMAWEFLAESAPAAPYPLDIILGSPWLVDWGPMMAALAETDEMVEVKSARFHQSMAEAVVLGAKKVGLKRVGLTGGCFQNQLLSRLVCARLREEGFEPIEHRRVPPNDGGIALGQAAFVAMGWRADFD